MNKINDINGNSKMAAVALSLARKNIIWTTKTFWICRENDVPG